MCGSLELAMVREGEVENDGGAGGGWREGDGDGDGDGDGTLAGTEFVVKTRRSGGGEGCGLGGFWAL